jgi:hypothetical protein
VGAIGWKGCIDLDSGPFAVKFAALFMQQNGSSTFFTEHARALHRGMDATTLDPSDNGVPYIDPARNLIGYGFRDGEYTNGDELYSALLYWNASQLMAEMYTAAGNVTAAADFTARAVKLRANATVNLWDQSNGMFRTSSGLESDTIDIWGSAFAGVSGFATPEQSKAMFQFFTTREADIFYAGQVREIPAPGYYDATHTGPNAYQNGGYWATPQHHVLPFIAMYDQSMACRLLNETIASYRMHGIWEWMGPFYPAAATGAPGYIASAAGTFFASEHMRCWE